MFYKEKKMPMLHWYIRKLYINFSTFLLLQVKKQKSEKVYKTFSNFSKLFPNFSLLFQLFSAFLLSLYRGQMQLLAKSRSLLNL